MHKKNYQKPTVKKVRLDVRSAVLGQCRVSGITIGKMGLEECKLTVAPCQT